MQWESDLSQGVKPIPEERLEPQIVLNMKEVGPSANSPEMGPLALSFDDKKGWVAENLGPTSRHWKRLARENSKQTSQEGENPIKGKRDGPIPLQELDPNSKNLKRRKGSKGGIYDQNG